MTPERVAKLRSVLNKRQPDLTVVTDHVHKGRNLSAIVRTCDAVGVMAMHSVVPNESYKAFLGTAKGSHRWVDVIRHNSIEDALLALKKADYQIVAADVGEHTLDYRDVDYSIPTALILGSEKDGLSALGASLTDRFIRVPMAGMVESFNVSVAAGIILSEALRQREKAGFYRQRRINQAIYDRLFFQWAHPAVRAYCDKNGLDYPPLDKDGEIIDPSGWYAAVRSTKRDQLP